MAHYIDCFVIPVARKNLKAHRAMAKVSAKAWKKAGGLDMILGGFKSFLST